MNGKTIPELFFDRVSNILESNTDDLIQNINAKSKGILTYSEIIPKIQELKEYLKYIKSESIEKLPENRFALLHNLLKPIFDRIDGIQNTEKISSETDDNQKLATIKFFTYPPHDDGLFERDKENIWSLICESLILYNFENQDEKFIKNKIKEIDNSVEIAKKTQQQLEEILNSAQTDLSKAGVSKHSNIFNQQAKDHNTNANNWRNYIIGLLISNAVIIIVASIFILFVIDDVTKSVKLSIIVGTLISLLSYSIVLCGKNYFAEKHNQSINQHKANCLSTFDTFIDAADQERKTAILLFATQTIFSHQKSGYLHKESESSNPNPIVEIVKNMTSSSKPTN